MFSPIAQIRYLGLATVKVGGSAEGLANLSKVLDAGLPCVLALLNSACNLDGWKQLREVSLVHFRWES
jgi:hypothetical protein